MAIEFIKIGAMSRSNGANSIEAAAYRSNSKLYDSSIGQTFDYTKKKDCIYANIILPETAFNQNINISNHPYNDRERLWNAVEEKENFHNRRDSARVGYEIIAALPKELSLKDNVKLINEFMYDNYVNKYNVAVDICIHDNKSENIHAHVMITPRSINGLNFANKKSRNILPPMRTNEKGQSFVIVDELNKKYANYQNKFFKENDIDLVVDQTKMYGNVHMRRSRLDGGFLKEDIEKNKKIDQRNLDEISKDHNIIIDTLAYRQSTFTKADIESLVLKCTAADKSKYQEVLNGVMRSSRLIDLGLGSYGRQAYTTKENYDKDIELIELVNDLGGRRNISINTNSIDNICDQYGLILEQRTALKYIANSGDLSCIVGYAGAGKSHTLKAVNELYTQQNKKVYGASISGKVSQALESDTKIESRTISSLLLSYKSNSTNLPQKGSVLVIDEAGMVGLDDMVDIVKLSKEKQLKLVLVGDPNQLEAIGKGSPFKQILDDVGFTPMKNIFRQHSLEDVTASIDLAESRIGKAIDSYAQRDKIHFKDKDTILREIVAHYMSYVKKDEINETLILSYTRKDVEMLNEAIRNNLISDRCLSLGLKIELEIPKSLHKNEFKSRRFARGDKIVFLRNGIIENQAAVKNGLFAKIVDINENIVTVKTLEKENSRELKFDFNKYKSFDHGYATTVHKSQGTTVNNTLLYVNSKGWNKNLAYVGMTRHRYDLDIYVNQDKYRNLDEVKRVLSSKSNKELNVADYIERKQPNSFFEIIAQRLGIFDRYHNKLSHQERDIVLYKKAIDDGTVESQRKLAAKIETYDYYNTYLDSFNIDRDVFTINALEYKLANYKDNGNIRLVNKIDHEKINSEFKKNLNNYAEIFGAKTCNSDKIVSFGKYNVSKETGMWWDDNLKSYKDPIDAMHKMIGLKDKQGRNYLEVTAIIAGISKDEMMYTVDVDKKRLEDQLTELKDKVYRQQAVARLWDVSQPLAGTIADRYLKEHRGITDTSNLELRYVPKGVEIMLSDGQRKPSHAPMLLVGGYNDKGDIVSVQRIYIDEDSASKNKYMENAKLSMGLISGTGGLIQRGSRDRVYIVEGVETGASIALADKEASVYYSFGIGNISKLDKLIKANNYKEVIIVADNDGIDSYVGRLTKDAQLKLQEQGISTGIIEPNKIDGLSKTDFNDILKIQGLDVLKEQVLSNVAEIKKEFTAIEDKEHLLLLTDISDVEKQRTQEIQKAEQLARLNNPSQNDIKLLRRSKTVANLCQEHIDKQLDIFERKKVDMSIDIKNSRYYRQAINIQAERNLVRIDNRDAIKEFTLAKDKEDITLLMDINILEHKRVKAAKTAALLDNYEERKYASIERLDDAYRSQKVANTYKGVIDNLLDEFENKKLTMSAQIQANRHFKSVVELKEQRQFEINHDKEIQRSVSRGISR